MKNETEILNLHLDKRLNDFQALQEKNLEAERLWAAWSWKSGLKATFPPITCLMGGTGTGKSTLFNSLAGGTISPVGMRRPFTVKAVILAHGAASTDLRNCPFLGLENDRNASLVLDDRPEAPNMVLVDTPDFDSIEIFNRIIAENFFIISDLLILITSQEKYADLAGHRMEQRARQWGKRTVFVMNKVSSEAAFNDFRRALEMKGYMAEPIRIERFPGSPELIEDLLERPEVSELIPAESDRVGSGNLRSEELARLKAHTAAVLEDLEEALDSQARRIGHVEQKIEQILKETSDELDLQLDAIVSEDLEAQIRDRLDGLLRKYDILFVPRMMIRNAVRSIFQSVGELFTGRWRESSVQEDEKQIRSEDFEGTRAAVRLRPLESAVAILNLRIAELLSLDQGLNDLREVARERVTRWDAQKIKEMYDQAFPGVEHLLEAEFDRLREGLSTLDEIKLYGSYTLWALLLITAEIVVGGGFTLLDALLNTAIVPFIPKWLLKLKILDVLREIGQRVDFEHRNALRGILERQANLYVREFSALLPDKEAFERLHKLRNKLR